MTMTKLRYLSDRNLLNKLTPPICMQHYPKLQRPKLVRANYNGLIDAEFTMRSPQYDIY